MVSSHPVESHPLESDFVEFNTEITFLPYLAAEWVNPPVFYNAVNVISQIICFAKTPLYYLDAVGHLVKLG